MTNTTGARPLTRSALFDVSDEMLYDLGKGTSKMVPSIHPHRRRSWTADALAAALAFLKAHPDHIISGSNTYAMLAKMKRRMPKGLVYKP